jgi:hypothetical protein
LYVKERHAGEAATSFFRRVDVGAVKAVLSDLEQLTPATATADDYVDLAETAEFKPKFKKASASA